MIRILPLMLLLLWHAPVTAKTVDQLIAAGELEINSWIEPATDIVVGQELQLTVEIATLRWFAGGTRLTLPETKGLVILRRDQFANNLNRTVNGANWVAQRWTIQLYPQREGSFTVPGIQLELAINDASAGEVRGTSTTAPLTFSASNPAGLGVGDKWVAAPRFSVKVNTDRDLTGLVPGDAFSVEVVQQASDVTAMMLPALSFPEFSGLAAYPEPPVLQNSSNRGTATAQRTQRITYLVEQPGQYQIAEQQLYWWDTDNAQLRTVVIPALVIDAGTAVTPAATASEPVSPATAAGQANYRLLVIVLCAAAALGLLIWRGLLRYRQSNASAWGRANRALRHGDAQTAAHWFYHWLNRSRPQPNWHSLRRSMVNPTPNTSDAPVNQLLATAFGKTRADLPGSLEQAPEHAARWWQRWLPAPVRLRLNPDNSAGERKASG